MKHVPFQAFGVPQPSLDRIVLTASERATLRKAADLLRAIREQRNAIVPTDFYAGDENDADLVFGWRICDDLARDGFIDAETVE